MMLMMMLLTKRMHDALLSVDDIRFGVGTAAIETRALCLSVCVFALKTKKQLQNGTPVFRCLGNPGVAA